MHFGFFWKSLRKSEPQVNPFKISDYKDQNFREQIKIHFLRINITFKNISGKVSGPFSDHF